MSQRFFVYPLIFVALMQLVPLMRSGHAGWYAAQITQLSLILLASLGAMYFEQDFVWVIVAWALVLAFLIVPRLVLRTVARPQLAGAYDRVASRWRLASRFVWGQLGRLYRAHARALNLWGTGDRTGAVRILEELQSAPVPRAVRGEVRVWELSLLVTNREFPDAVAFYESVGDWGALSSATTARLLAARAYAEVGRLENALHCLHLVVISPRTIGPLERQLWMTRVCVAALAGDEAELDWLLRAGNTQWDGRDFPRVAAYWRGRCALVRGDGASAVRELTRAFALTPARERLWRGAITKYVNQAQSLSGAGNVAEVTIAAGSPGYEAAMRALHQAEQQTAKWRALMFVGRPEPVTFVLVALIAGVFVADEVAFGGFLGQPLWLVFGNMPDEVRHGEWWRPLTALFLHANWLHLAMNSAALWLFGSAIERTLGRWRFVTIFLLAGAAGNAISVMMARYDLSVGASGGIFGAIGAFAVTVFRLNTPLYDTVRQRLLVLVLSLVACDLVIGALEPQVDNLAHAGGFIAGLALTTLLWPQRKQAASGTVDATAAV